MSYQEKRNIVSIISTVLITVFYGMYVFQLYQEASRNPATVVSFWGSVILTLIQVLIVFKIIIHIVFNIINKIATNEDEPSLTDERDRLFELKATRNSYYVFMLGFFLSMGTLALDMPPSVMFIVIPSAMIVSCVIGDISQLYFYRRGF